jgi:hypothetical protein
VPHASPPDGSRPGGKSPFRHWQSLGDGIVVSLVVVGPTFLVEELWRGRPLIDQGGLWWVIPAAIMAIGFFAGGTIAGRHRKSPKGAFRQGLLVASLTIVLVFIADMIRRLVLSEGMELTILGYWVAAAAAALLVGGLGGANGRRRTLRAKQRRQMDRFL